DRVPGCRGGYLDSPLAFDAAEHGIMPRTVLGGEPEQFLVLEAAPAALAHPGLSPASLAGGRVEVALGPRNYFNHGNPTPPPPRPNDRPDRFVARCPSPGMVSGRAQCNRPRSPGWPASLRGRDHSGPAYQRNRRPARSPLRSFGCQLCG